MTWRKPSLARGMVLGIATLGIGAPVAAQTSPIDWTARPPETLAAPSDHAAETSTEADANFPGHSPPGKDTDLTSKPFGRVSTRIENRISSRVQSRIDRTSDAAAGIPDPYGRADNRARAVGQISKPRQ